MALIFKTRPWIKPELMAKTEAITFVTRDSLTLYGYLTTPNNRSAPYPTVVLLHGGPQDRDYWGFDSEVQVLANKGYAVLQVNYRGSTGFGYKISAENEFAFHKMYLDVIDATRYVTQKGTADPDRIAVMGYSFGGFLSISCVANVPDLYRCAISNAGVFNWKKHVKSKRGKYGNYAFDFYRANLGGDDSKNYLEDISVMKKAENIRVPVFLGGGSDDNNVQIEQSVKLTRLLKNNGVEVVTFFKKGERHGFVFQKNMNIYYKAVLTFLKKNMSKK